MANAQNAANATNATNAVDSTKLGGKEASKYMLKEEVKNVTAAYQEKEWTTPGTYDWVVPAGVNSILVTTVGGGGGFGYVRYTVPWVSDSSSTNKYWHLFSGGGGGGVVPNVVVPVTQGETLQIVVGAGGANAGNAAYVSDIMTWAESSNASGKAGIAGGSSYIKQKGATVASTVAPGGGGGSGSVVYSNYDSIFKCDTYYQPGGAAGNSRASAGGYIYFLYGNNKYGGAITAVNSQYAKGGEGKLRWEELGPNFYNESSQKYCAQGSYSAGGGGASWGDGGSKEMKYGSRAGIGGGAMKYSYHASVYSGHGMVKILAIGTTYD